MSEHRAGAAGGPDTNSHRRAAAVFAHHVHEREIERIEELLLFGSTARGEASGIDSDVDFLAIVADDADRQAIASDYATSRTT